MKQGYQVQVAESGSLDMYQVHAGYLIVPEEAAGTTQSAGIPTDRDIVMQVIATDIVRSRTGTDKKGVARPVPATGHTSILMAAAAVNSRHPAEQSYLSLLKVSRQQSKMK